MLRRALRPLLVVVLLMAVFPHIAPYTTAKFRGAGANLQGKSLVLAPLAGADLSKANLSGANLSGANLESAGLAAAKLRGANLTNANLSYAELVGADLRDANLNRAVLLNADFRRAQLKGVNLSFGIYNKGTRWPYGFSPTAHGAKPLTGQGADELAR